MGRPLEPTADEVADAQARLMETGYGPGEMAGYVLGAVESALSLAADSRTSADRDSNIRRARAWLLAHGALRRQRLAAIDARLASKPQTGGSDG